MQEYIGTGRRKTSVSSVRLRPGNGAITVNNRPVEKYFPLEIQRQSILNPLKEHELQGKYDLVIRVSGGGIEGQVIATRLGLARALVLEDETRREKLKEFGFLTRDPRRRERKKYGLAGARKRFQFSKR